MPNIISMRQVKLRKRHKKRKQSHLLERDLSKLSKRMPSRLALMHALSNVSWQLVRGQFDTITISALGWKWFASAHYDKRQEWRTNTAVGEEWGSMSNSLISDSDPWHQKHARNPCCKGTGACQCRSFIMFLVQSDSSLLTFPVIYLSAAISVMTQRLSCPSSFVNTHIKCFDWQEQQGLNVSRV